MFKGKPKVVVIVGPTASGKTALSLKLALRLRSERAQKWDVEIISADSRAIYRKLNIGSAKPERDAVSYKRQVTSQKRPGAYGLKPKAGYLVNGIPHHLIDIVEPNKTLTLAQYKELSSAKVLDIASQDKVPFLVGGTALYIYTVIDNWQIPEIPANQKLRSKLEKQSLEKLYRQLLKKDPKAKNFIDPKNKRRIIRALEVIEATKKPFSEQRKMGQPLFESLILGIKRTPTELKKIIAARTKKMLKAGLIQEVKGILKKYSSKLPALSGIHYKEIISYLKKEITLKEAVELINQNDEQLVRRQMTWFKKDKRIKWTKSNREAENLIRKFL